jgi:hypothetical protein
MKKTYLALASALMLAAAFFNMPARAQLTSTITTQKHDPTFSMGRDFYLAFPSNYWGENLGGKYMRIYITSTKNTTTWVEFDTTRDSIPVRPYEVSNFLVPAFWEMESSGIVENQGIHVWSDDADLCVYFISHNEYTSDGSYVIPTIGWGTDYVVAAYASLYEGSTGGYVYDLPSECIIVANQDSTVVNIIPSCNCRQCTTGSIAGNPQASTVAFPAGKTFSDTLNRGQSMQLMPVWATGPTGFDLTGTIIHANKPIGMIGGSVDPDIPNGFPYDDFACEMIPPISRWGETYYATSFAQPPNSTDDDADYLFIASKAGQIIHRQACTDSPYIECTIPNQYGIYWDELPLGQKFWSNAPFLCVTYINSSSYPQGNNYGEGDPAETNINPREGFTKTVIFEAPISIGDKMPYYNYANITVNVKDAQKTLFDGKALSGIPAQCIDSNWEIFTVTNVTPGAHTVTGDDSGVGVYIYGYGFDESYAWSSPALCSTFQSKDSVPPVVTLSENCFNGSVLISDTGKLASKLDMLRLDTAFNMTYKPDTSWSDGTVKDSTFYNFFVVDQTEPAYLQVSAFDYAGNRTTITTGYKSDYTEIMPPLRNLGIYTGGIPITPNIGYDTLINEGTTPFNTDGLHLKYGKAGFSIYDSIGGPFDTSALAPGTRRLIQIQFIDPTNQRQVDSIIFGDTCDLQSVAVIGSGSTADFTVSSQTWPNEPLTVPPTCYSKLVTIENLSGIAITIDSAWWSDTVHFKPVSPIAITIPPAPASVQILIEYCPDSNSAITPNHTQGSWFSPHVESGGIESPRFDSLIGWAFAPLAVEDKNNPATQASVIMMEDGRSLEIILPADITAPANFELVNVLGQSVLREAFPPGTQTIDASGLPRGVYFWRLTAGEMNNIGKAILGQ